MSDTTDTLSSNYSDTSLISHMDSRTVSDIVINGQWVLHDPILNYVWHIITQQAAPSTETEVSWRWRCSNSGNFSFASAWELVRSAGINFQLARIVWHPFHSWKMSLCLLRALKGKLLTRYFLKTVGVSESDQRMLCSSGQESIHHLFCPVPLLCIYLDIVWAEIGYNLFYGNSTS